MNRLGLTSVILLSITAMLAVAPGCAKKAKKSSAPLAAVPSPTPTAEPTPAGRPSAETLASCNAKGKSWIPAPAPAKCGGTLVAWECCREQIDARFPNLKNQIAKAFADHADKVLYNCEATDAKQTRLYFFKQDEDGAYEYKNINLLDFESAVSGDIVCAKKPPKKLPLAGLVGDAD